MSLFAQPFPSKTSTCGWRPFAPIVGRLGEATLFHPLAVQRPALQLICSKERKFLVVSKLKISQE